MRFFLTMDKLGWLYRGGRLSSELALWRWKTQTEPQVTFLNHPSCLLWKADKGNILSVCLMISQLTN